MENANLSNFQLGNTCSNGGFWTIAMLVYWRVEMDLCLTPP